MTIRTGKDVTGVAMRDLRNKLGIGQTAFWRTVGVKQSAGSKYEAGGFIPEPIRRLLFIRYVAGIDLDPFTPDGAAGLRKLSAAKP